jgi:hypothetical protein
MGLAAVSPVRGASTVSTGGGASCTCLPRDWVGEGGTARSKGWLWLEGAYEVAEDAKSASVTVDVERLLDDEGGAGAEKVLEAAETIESCELGSSALYSLGMSCCGAVVMSSEDCVSCVSLLPQIASAHSSCGGVGR